MISKVIRTAKDYNAQSMEMNINRTFSLDHDKALDKIMPPEIVEGAVENWFRSLPVLLKLPVVDIQVVGKYEHEVITIYVHLRLLQDATTPGTSVEDKFPEVKEFERIVTDPNNGILMVYKQMYPEVNMAQYKIDVVVYPSETTMLGGGSRWGKEDEAQAILQQAPIKGPETPPKSRLQTMTEEGRIPMGDLSQLPPNMGKSKVNFKWVTAGLLHTDLYMNMKPVEQNAYIMGHKDEFSNEENAAMFYPHTKDEWTRVQLVEYSKSEALATRLYRNTKSIAVKKRAIPFITDPAILKEQAVEESAFGGSEATGKLTSKPEMRPFMQSLQETGINNPVVDRNIKTVKKQDPQV
jgi:hypothetical protein